MPCSCFLTASARTSITWPSQPLIKNTDDSLKTYMSANAESVPQGEMDKKVFAFLQDLGNAHPAYAYAIVGTAAGGYVSWPDDPKLSNYDPRQRPWYKAAQAKPGKPLRTAAYYWAQDDATYVSTVRTIDNKLGSNGGVVSIDVTLKQLTEIVKQIKLGETGYLMLLENSGTVLVDPKQPEHNFKPLDSLGEGYAQLAKAGKGLVEVELNGERYMANVWPSEQLGWTFVGLIKQSDVMSAATQLTWLIAIIAAVLARAVRRGRRQFRQPDRAPDPQRRQWSGRHRAGRRRPDQKPRHPWQRRNRATGQLVQSVPRRRSAV